MRPISAPPTRPTAARAAGWGARRARERGLLQLRLPEVRNAIMVARAERAQSGGLTLERVLLEYERIALSDLARLLGSGAEGDRPRPLMGLSPDDAAAIVSVAFDRDGAPVRIRLHDKGFALAALATYFNIYEREQWRDESEGARAKLVGWLEAMAAAKPPQAEGEAAS